MLLQSKLCSCFFRCVGRTKLMQEYLFCSSLQYPCSVAGCFQYEFLMCLLISVMILAVLHRGDRPQAWRYIQSCFSGFEVSWAVRIANVRDSILWASTMAKGWALNFWAARRALPHLSWLSIQFIPYRKFWLRIFWLFKRWLMES